jgi:hypothetical protein
MLKNQCENHGCTLEAQYTIYKLDPTDFSKKWLHVCNLCEQGIAQQNERLRFRYPDVTWKDLELSNKPKSYLFR